MHVLQGLPHTLAKIATVSFIWPLVPRPSNQFLHHFLCTTCFNVSSVRQEPLVLYAKEKRGGEFTLYCIGRSVYMWPDLTKGQI